MGPRVHLLSKVAPELHGAANGLQLVKAVDLVELGVVGNEETAAHAGKLREGDVGQTVVADERDVTRLNRRQVRSAERGEQVLVETEGAVDGLEGGDVEA